MNILVTGASGFVGSHLSKRLSTNRKDTVYGLVKGIFACGKDIRVPSDVIAVAGDVLHYDWLERFLTLEKIDEIYHLAAVATVESGSIFPEQTLAVNVGGTWNILCAARKAGVARVIVASSDKAYGEQERLPIPESAPLNAIAPYDLSKMMADKVAQMYLRSYGMNVGITRCSNIYGEGDFNFTRIVPYTIRCLIENQSPKINSDGSPVRDYLYIDDAVDGYIALMEQMRSNKQNGAFNFGTGVGTSVRELINTIYSIFTKMTAVEPPSPQFGDALPSIKKQFLYIDKAKYFLAWRPNYTLKAGLSKTISWYLNYFNYFKGLSLSTERKGE